MKIHSIRLTGLVIGVPQMFEYLDKMQDRVINFVTNHSNIKEEKFKDLMFAKGNLTRDIGTNVVGTDAVEYGLIDEVGGVDRKSTRLNSSHVAISYAVFCLKKKKAKKTSIYTRVQVA